MNRDDYIEMLAALVELASSVGDAVFAGVSMDAAVAYSRLRRRRAGGRGDCPARQGRDRRAMEDPFMVCWPCLFDLLLLRSPSAFNHVGRSDTGTILMITRSTCVLACCSCVLACCSKPLLRSFSDNYS